jgi:hypothetical protein
MHRQPPGPHRFLPPAQPAFGVNVESLTNRKIEIDASIDLIREIRNLLG